VVLRDELGEAALVLGEEGEVLHEVEQALLVSGAPEEHLERDLAPFERALDQAFDQAFGLPRRADLTAEEREPPADVEPAVVGDQWQAPSMQACPASTSHSL